MDRRVSDPSPAMDTASTSEVFESLLVMAEEASGLKGKKLAALVGVKAAMVMTLSSLDTAIEEENLEGKVLGALRHTVSREVSRSRSEKYLRDVGEKVPNVMKLILVGVLSGYLMIGGVGAGPTNPKEESPMGKTKDPLMGARLDLRDHRWDLALKGYQKVLDSGNRSEEVLFRVAELQIKAKDYVGAENTCDELAVVAPSKASVVRGWIEETKPGGSKSKAKLHYSDADKQGVRLAPSLVEGVK